MKKCRISGENLLEKIFLTPTLGSLIFFRCLLFGTQNIFDAYSFLTPLPLAINNYRSLNITNKNLIKSKETIVSK